LFGCCWIHFNPHVLGWIRVEFSSSSTPIHLNTCGLMRIWLHPNKALGGYPDYEFHIVRVLKDGKLTKSAFELREFPPEKAEWPCFSLFGPVCLAALAYIQANAVQLYTCLVACIASYAGLHTWAELLSHPTKN
jgi:hypothetical protein